MDNTRELNVTHKSKSYRLSIKLRQGNSGGLIVFLHGWGGSKDSFDGAFSSDVLKGYDICSIDLLGFGESDKPEGFSYDLLDQAEVVVQAVNSLKADRVYLVGHSMGGGIGLLAAAQIKNLGTFISADSNLAPNGISEGARTVAKQSLRLFSRVTLPLLIALLRRHPRRSMRPWAHWFSEASPLALHRSVQSLVAWSDSGKLLPIFMLLPHKAYLYGARSKRRKDVVPTLPEDIVYGVSAGHALMSDNPKDFYNAVAKIIFS